MHCWLPYTSLLLLMLGVPGDATVYSRRLVIVDDEPLYTFRQAGLKCISYHMYPADEYDIMYPLESRAAAGEPHVTACGFVKSDRYHGLKPEYDANGAVTMVRCADIPPSGISKVPLVAYCLQKSYINNWGLLESGVVFVPHARGPVMTASFNEAEAVCNNLGADIAFERRVSEDFKYCPCFWARKRFDRAVQWKHQPKVFNTGCPDMFAECPEVPGQSYPILCFGFPPVPVIPEGYSGYCGSLGVYYKYDRKMYNTRAERDTVCAAASGGMLAEPETEEEYQCLVEWLRNEPNMPVLWYADLGFTADNIAIYSWSTGQVTTVLDSHWVNRDPSTTNLRCLVMDTGRAAGEFGKVKQVWCDVSSQYYPSICQIRV